MITTASSEARERMLTLGAWLVGLGAVFLVKQLMRWEWSEAWPLFVILLGGGGMVSAVVQRRRSRIGLWAVWWPLAILIVGVAFLLATTGAIALTPAQLVGWWPVAAIVVGIGFLIGAVFVKDRDVRTERLAVPLDGLTGAEIRLKFGGGELAVGQAEPGMLVSGQFDGGVVQRSRGPGRIELEPYDPSTQFFSGRPIRWQLGITPDIPVDLRVESGANRSSIDLHGLRIRQLELHTGASETRVRLPAAGQTSVRLEAGMASVELEVPPGVAARVRGRVALGSTNVDEARFPRSPEGWSSPDFEAAANRVEIAIDGGLGSIRIR